MKNTENTKNDKAKTLTVIVIVLLVVGVASLLSSLWLSARHVIWQKTVLVRLEDELTKQKAALDVLNTTLDKVSMERDDNINRVILLRVDALLQMAKFSLLTNRNVDAALRFFSMAESSLASSKSADLLHVRELLAEEGKALQEMSKLDVTKTVARLEVINQEIGKLSILPKELPQRKDLANDVVSDDLKTPKKQANRWQDFWQGASKALKQAVIIRKQSNAETVFLNSEQATSMILSLQNKIVIAEWAILHYDEELYQKNLQQVSDALQTYFLRMNPSQAANIIAALQEMKKINVKLIVPSFNQTEQAIQAVLTK
ncbi:MAG: uroporphyrinogen-III C-methyltransferase [Gammaproteobacteria bacterium]